MRRIRCGPRLGGEGPLFPTTRRVCKVWYWSRLNCQNGFLLQLDVCRRRRESHSVCIGSELRTAIGGHSRYRHLNKDSVGLGPSTTRAHGCDQYLVLPICTSSSPEWRNVRLSSVGGRTQSIHATNAEAVTAFSKSPSVKWSRFLQTRRMFVCS